MSELEKLLSQITDIIDTGLTKDGVASILNLLEISFPVKLLDEMKLYGDYLPKNNEIGVSDEKRYLHFLWDVLDKSPMCLVANFSILYRRILAKKLFKSCGENFIAEENVRFNVPDNIEVGDNVFLNRDVYIDSKGGVKLGDSVALTEGVMIFTHSHSEDNHEERTYSPVIIEDYAKICCRATILPGVKIEKQAIVAAGAIIDKNVEVNSLVAGIPGKFVRERNNLNCAGDELNHIWLHNGIFQ